MTALTTMILDPEGRSIVRPNNVIPSSISASTESRPLTKSAPTTAPHRLVVPPMTSIASVMNVRSRYTASHVDRDEVDVEAAGEAGEEPGERERAETLPVDRDADGPGGGGILARRAELPPEAAPLIRERRDDHQHARRRSPA